MISVGLKFNLQLASRHTHLQCPTAAFWPQSWAPARWFSEQSQRQRWLYNLQGTASWRTAGRCWFSRRPRFQWRELWTVSPTMVPLRVLPWRAQPGLSKPAPESSLNSLVQFEENAALNQPFFLPLQLLLNDFSSVSFFRENHKLLTFGSIKWTETTPRHAWGGGKKSQHLRKYSFYSNGTCFLSNTLQ